MCGYSVYHLIVSFSFGTLRWRISFFSSGSLARFLLLVRGWRIRSGSGIARTRFDHILWRVADLWDFMRFLRCRIWSKYSLPVRSPHHPIWPSITIWWNCICSVMATISYFGFLAQLFLGFGYIWLRRVDLRRRIQFGFRRAGFWSILRQRDS